MSVTVENAAAYVNAKADDAIVAVLLDQAQALIDGELTPEGKAKATNSVDNRKVYDYMHLQVFSELWARRSSPEGQLRWGPDGQAVFLSSDVLISIRPILKKFKPLGKVW